MKPNRKVVQWRLFALAADRGIRSASEFARRMKERTGREISNSHITRYFGVNPPALTLEILADLLTTLDARADELLQVVEADDAAVPHEASAREVKRRAVPEERIYGPKITAFPRPKRPDRKT